MKATDEPIKELEQLTSVLDLADRLRAVQTQKTFWRKFCEALVIGAGVSIIGSLVVGLALMLGTVFTEAWSDMSQKVDTIRVEAKEADEAILQTATASRVAISELSKTIPTLDQSESISRIWQVLGPLSNDVAALKATQGISAGMGGFDPESSIGLTPSLVEVDEERVRSEAERAFKEFQSSPQLLEALNELDMVQTQIEK
jgi:hypothetical protein